MVTEPTLDDAADYRFDNLYRVNWIEKLPDYQYQCLHLPFYQICDTFGSKSHTATYVPVYLYGTGAGRIAGIMDNTQLARRVMALLGKE